jgi:hypothetical protein
MKSFRKLLGALSLSCCVSWAEGATHSIARIWDEEILAAIRIDLPHPPVHARNLFHLSVAMYDAWAAYDSQAVGYLYHGKHTATDIEAARREAISYAAYRILVERYDLSRSASQTLTRLDAKFVALGYQPENHSRDVSTPAGVGNSVAAAVSGYFFEDGALQNRAYADFPSFLGGYTAVNLPLITGSRGTLISSPNRWAPLAITNATSQNGLTADVIQKFLGAQWKGVRPFALSRTDSNKPWIDPGPPPQLRGAGDEQYRNEVVEIIRYSSELTPDDGVTVDISPGAFGNSSLGANDGTGHPVNPTTAAPYPPNVVKRGDFARILAEFWADGPNSETPPGHWNSLANQVSDHPSFVKRIGGAGPVLGDLEWDVKLYFALNSALHDAACAAWTLKRHYDGYRPIAAIRYMAERGQSSIPGVFSYHRDGLPLVSNLIELVTSDTAKPDGRHAGLSPGMVAIRAWPGQPSDPVHQYSGVKWIAAVDWMPFQKKTFVTPAFPGYVSGHSTFSRSAAEVLAAFTGSPFFPGGMGTYTVAADVALTFERGPSQPIQLQWGTYFDAADQAGLSRLWGGIHVSADDLTGRQIGATCGRQAWDLARRYFDGSILSEVPIVSMRPLDVFECEISFPTVRGFTYRLQSTTGLHLPFADEPGTSILATDSQRLHLDTIDGQKKFFRVVRDLNP